MAAAVCHGKCVLRVVVGMTAGNVGTHQLTSKLVLLFAASIAARHDFTDADIVDFLSKSTFAVLPAIC